MSVNPRISINTINTSETKTTHFNGARYYDPTLERFISEDPIGFASGDYNWYRYVGNDSINRIDPMGLEDSFSNPAICIAVAAGKTGKSIKKCNDLVMDAFNDYAYMRNDDYTKMCPEAPASPTSCACGCLATDFYENLKKHCKPKLKKTEIAQKDKR